MKTNPTLRRHCNPENVHIPSIHIKPFILNIIIEISTSAIFIRIIAPYPSDMSCKKKMKKNKFCLQPNKRIMKTA